MKQRPFRICLPALFGAILLNSLAYQSVQAAPLSGSDFATMAVRCASGIAPRILHAVALTESGLDPWALHDNTSGVSKKPDTFDAAFADARMWVALGHSVDVGLMQVNSANLSALNMTVQTALDPCTSLAGGAAVLRAAYGRGDTPANQQVALLMALSRYNTGSPLRGIMNGYARAVMAHADGMLPAPAARPQRTTSELAVVAPDANAPPAWDVGAVGAYAQAHGAPWLVSSAARPTVAQATPGHPALAPGRDVLAAIAFQSNAAGAVASTQPNSRNHQ